MITAYDLGPNAIRELRRRRKSEGRMSKRRFPDGWDEGRIQQVIEHYDGQSDDEAVIEDEAAFGSATHTAVEVPVDLDPEVRQLMARAKAG